MDVASSPLSVVECGQCKKRETIRWLCDHHLQFVSNFVSATIKGALKHTLQDLGLSRADVTITARAYRTDESVHELSGHCRMESCRFSLVIFGREEAQFFDTLLREEKGVKLSAGMHLVSLRVFGTELSPARVLMRDSSPSRIVHVRDASLIAKSMRGLLVRECGE
jgi:serine kinase of HPr protein (carbohydrate metabolism regulator)